MMTHPNDVISIHVIQVQSVLKFSGCSLVFCFFFLPRTQRLSYVSGLVQFLRVAMASCVAHSGWCEALIAPNLSPHGWAEET